MSAVLCGAVALTWATVASATGFIGIRGTPTARDSYKPNAIRAASVEQGQLESVGPSQRSLRIGYFGHWGGQVCHGVAPIPIVAESATSVTIAFRQPDPSTVNCYLPGPTRPGSLVVNLAAPIAGRSVLGLSLGNGALSHLDRRFLDMSPSTKFPLRLHSVVGLSPADATAMLTDFSSENEYCDPFTVHHYRCGPPPIVNIVVRNTGRAVGPLPVVVVQQPAPGAIIRKQGSRVVLLVAP